MNRTLSQREVADMLEVSVPTVRRWVRKGYFPAPAYIGRRAVYAPVTVHRWLEQRFKSPAVDVSKDGTAIEPRL